MGEWGNGEKENLGGYVPEAHNIYRIKEDIYNIPSRTGRDNPGNISRL
jgi:hypothetical protein